MDIMNKYCYNCVWFDGEKGDGFQFCDEHECNTHELNMCYRWKEKLACEDDLND